MMPGFGYTASRLDIVIRLDTFRGAPANMAIFTWKQRALALALALGVVHGGNAIPAPSDDSPQLQQQRELFVQTRQQLARGQAAPQLAKLKDYPLYPYLEATQLKQQLRALPYAKVDDFLVRHSDKVVGDLVREWWLAQLAFQNQWASYLSYYRDGYGVAFRCWRIEALHHTGKATEALVATERVWLTGRSLPEQCDPAISRWLASSRDTQPLIWKRALLSLEAGQSGLAKYLVSKLRGPWQQPGQQALQLAKNPATLRTLLPGLPRTERSGDLATLALSQLARTQTDRAEALWDSALAAKLLTPGQSSVVRREIGRQRIAALGSEALPWLLRRDPDGEDEFLLEWRIRLGLRTGRWDDILAWTGQLSAEAAATPRWQYWRSRALLEQSAESSKREGRELLASLAADRTYYGFLAADLIGVPYQLNHEPLRPGITPQQIAQNPGLQRVQEFYRLGERISANREWSRNFSALSDPERQAATLLVQSWGWHIQAIRSAADAGGWNDLAIRFPLAYERQIREGARRAEIPSEWLFAVARQESAFIADAKSSAGAMGLLQLLPGTARQVATKLGISHSPAKLIDPGQSARLGGAYLRELMDRYDNNRVLATAAYNAGPGRISRWLRAHPEPLDVAIWVESLPYRETREYVQNVLAYSVIYSHHLGAEKIFLAANERSIGEASIQISRK